MHNKLAKELFKGVFGVHDGWKRLHQDEHWKGGSQCHSSSWARYVQGYQVIFALMMWKDLCFVYPTTEVQV